MANTYSLDLEASSSQYASITDASQTGLNLSTDFTIECWFKVESDINGVLFSKDTFTTTGTSRSYSLYRSDDGRLNVTFHSDDSTETHIRTDAGVVDALGVWTHVAVSVDISVPSAQFYLNGQAITTTNFSSAATSIQDSTADVNIGKRNGTSPTYFDGLIDDVRVWNDIRTASEIQDNIGVELVGTEANLQGYWKLNNDYTDETSNGNDLTASGSPVFSTTIPWTGSLVDVSTDGTLATNLVSYWELEEASGTRVDSHGSNDLTDNNTVLSTTGKIGDCATFVAANTEYLDSAFQPAAGDGSYALWFKTGSSSQQEIIGHDSTGAQGWVRRITINAGTVTGYASFVGSDMTINSTAATYADDAWHHVVFKWGTGGGALYIDGVLDATSTTTTSTVGTTNANTQIGRNYNGGSPVWYMDGEVDEAALWSRGLTAGEVSNLYNSDSGLPYVGGVTYTLALAVGAYVYTGVAVGLLTTVRLAMAVGAYVYTGFAVGLVNLFSVVMGTGSYVYTGIDTGLIKTSKLLMAAGSYTYTGIAVILTRLFTLAMSAGTYVYTGLNLPFPALWNNLAKSVSSWTNSAKSTSTWTNKPKS